MQQRLGYIYGFAAYLCWGAFPLYFIMLSGPNPFEVVPWRVLSALAFCLIAVSLMRQWGPVGQIFRSGKTLGWFALSSVLLYANWQIYVIGITTGHVVETALGYFINPLVTILIGVVFRKERLTNAQWVAVGIAAIGVTVSAIAYGKFPFIALGLALTFGLYGAVRKHLSEGYSALTALTVETMFGTVLAAVQLVVITLVVGSLTAFSFGTQTTIVLLLSGTVTAIPLLLFAAGTKRLPLSTMGFIQFITPILTFLTGYFLLNEEMSLARWIGFIAVWVALIVLVTDILYRMRKQSRTITEPMTNTDTIAVQSGG